MATEFLEQIRILLVDDQQITRWGIEKLIHSSKATMKVVGAVSSYAEGLEMASNMNPDIILLEAEINGESGLGRIPEFISISPAHILVFTHLRGHQIHDQAIMAGARGVVRKYDDAEDILKAIQKVYDRELWVDRAAAGRILVEISRERDAEKTDPDRRKIARLTSRERQIISVLTTEDLSGTTKSVAEKLHISEHTLRNHMTSIYSKLELSNRCELFVFARKHAL